MGWLVVFFDLPTVTPSDKKASAAFRKKLLEDGYLMIQWSVYARSCVTYDRVLTHTRRLKSFLPSQGAVRCLFVTNIQWKIAFLSMGMILPPYTPRKSNLNNFSSGDSFPRLHHYMLTINSKGATYCSTLVIGFKAKLARSPLSLHPDCSTLVIGFKAKHGYLSSLSFSHCSTLVIGFKAKPTFTRHCKSSDCSTLVIGFKAKPNFVESGSAQNCSTLVIGFKAKLCVVASAAPRIVAPL